MAAVRLLAALAGLFVTKRDGIALISCEGDEPSQDILDLAAAIEGLSLAPAPRVFVMAGRMRRSAFGAFRFVSRLVSMLRLIAVSRVVAIDAYCPAVSIPKKRAGQIVLQLWHAPEAIKKFSLQITDTPSGYAGRTAEILCMHKGYDFILCPADATRPFFAEAFGYPEDVFLKYGLPSLDRIGLMRRPEADKEESAERRTAREAIFDKYPMLGSEGRRPLTIVYAPTFRDGAAVDVAGLARAFERALRDVSAVWKTAGEAVWPGSSMNDAEAFYEVWSGITLVLKLHPLDKLTAEAAGAAERAGTGAHSFGGNTLEPAAPLFSIVRDTDIPLIDWYAVADIVVTDYSGVAIDAAVAGIASYYYIYDIDDFSARRGLNVDLREEAVGGYAFEDADSLARQTLCDFAQIPVGGPSLYDYGVLAAFAAKYLEVPLSGNTEKIAAFIAKAYEDSQRTRERF